MRVAGLTTCAKIAWWALLKSQVWRHQGYICPWVDQIAGLWKTLDCTPWSETQQASNKSWLEPKGSIQLCTGHLSKKRIKLPDLVRDSVRWPRADPDSVDMWCPTSRCSSLAQGCSETQKAMTDVSIVAAWQVPLADLPQELFHNTQLLKDSKPCDVLYELHWESCKFLFVWGPEQKTQRAAPDSDRREEVREGKVKVIPPEVLINMTPLKTMPEKLASSRTVTAYKSNNSKKENVCHFQHSSLAKSCGSRNRK